MITSWNANAFHNTGPLVGESTNHQESPFTQRAVMQSFDVSFDDHMDKLLLKQLSFW